MAELGVLINACLCVLECFSKLLQCFKWIFFLSCINIKSAESEKKREKIQNLECMIFISFEEVLLPQIARDIGGLMDNKSIFKDIGEGESNLCQGSPPDPRSYPHVRPAGGVIGFV